MPLLFVLMMCLLGIGIAIFRRSPEAFLEGSTEDAPLRLTRWAVDLLSPRRHEWGQAMLGELGQIEGRSARMRFAIGCVVTALVLPPWGRAAVGVSALTAVAVASVGLYASTAITYGLGAGTWVAAAVLVVLLIGYLLGACALIRRRGVAIPGLLGGLFVALATMTLSGFTFYDRIAPDIAPGHRWFEMVVVPLIVGAVGTWWSGSPVIGRRVARLAAISASLGLYLYGTLAVAVVGAGGPPDDSGSVQYIVGDRLGTNLVLLVLTTLVTATVGWAGAAIAGRLRRDVSTSPPELFLPVDGTDSQQEAGS